MQHKIKSEYLPLLKEKITPAIAKCVKFGIPFDFKVIEEIEEDEQKYTIIEVTDTVKLNNWVFAASIDQTPNGNIIRNARGIDLPVKFRNTDCICEHCNSYRQRKYLFVVYNELTDEYKQVGKSCLKVYTGIDTRAIAHYFSIIDNIENAESCGEEYELWSRCYSPKEFTIKTFLEDICEIVRIWGFASTKSETSTVGRYEDLYNYRHKEIPFKDNSNLRYKFKKLLEEVDFNSDRQKEKVEKILIWLNEQDDTTEYFYNLKLICKEYFAPFKYKGIVASLVNAYDKAMDIQKRNKENAEKSKSEYIGVVGDKITVKVESFECVTSFETKFGYYPTTNYVYKFVDNNENIYIWKTTKYINKAGQVYGTVKAHSDYKGIKQTELTRCKIKESL